MNVQSVVSEVENLLVYLPGEVSKNVNRVELITTVANAVAKAAADPNVQTGAADVLQAVVDAADVIFPASSIYKRLAVAFLTIAVNLYKNAHAATNPAPAAS